MNTVRKFIGFIAKILVLVVLIYTIIAFFSDVKGEAFYGAFETYSFNENWSIHNGDTDYTSRLPVFYENTEDDHWILTNILPDYVVDGMELGIRSSHQDIQIYVNGELRTSYTSEGIKGMGSYLPSSYVFVPLEMEDAGKEIKFDIVVKKHPKFNNVVIGYGSNAWFPILAQNLPIAIAGAFLMIVGLGAIFVYYCLKRFELFGEPILYLALMMFVTGGWIVSESRLRQLIFASPSYSSIIAFMYIELIGGFALLYFNEVQKHKYEKWYLLCEIGVFGQAFINFVLHIFGVAELYSTLKYAHLWMIVCFVLCFVTIIIDVLQRRSREYRYIGYGMLTFVILCILEFACYFVVEFHLLGIYVSIGLFLMFLSTVIQSIADAVAKEKSRRIDQQNRTIETMRTIAGTIDAKDEYTGGHSARVAQYARELASSVRKKYGLTEEDLQQIYYIGLMHDIGKIGIPDHILNKAGKLTDEEYNIMKTHTTVGSDIFQHLNYVQGLQDGIRHHHERYDGKGYPDRLKGNEISLVARILCIADCYDAMTSDRVYRKRLSEAAVYEELKINAGKQFDPELIDAFISMKRA